MKSEWALKREKLSPLLLAIGKCEGVIVPLGIAKKMGALHDSLENHILCMDREEAEIKKEGGE